MESGSFFSFSAYHSASFKDLNAFARETDPGDTMAVTYLTFMAFPFPGMQFLHTFKRSFVAFIANIKPLFLFFI